MSNSNPPIGQPETTGRYLVLLREDDVDAGIQALYNTAGISGVARARDFEDNAVIPERVKDTDTVVFDGLSVAVAPLNPEQFHSLSVACGSSQPVLAVEPERVVYALADVGLPKLGQPIPSSATNFSVEYLQGYRDAVVHLVDKLTGEAQIGVAKAQFEEEVEATWGLQATKVINSPFSGRGIKVAILDTGMDLTHPDFVGRKIVSKSFVSNEEVQDKQGHGTHCIGTSCGSLNPSIPPRYGVAYNAEIYAGKVLNNRGSGTDRDILSGIQWAIANDCHIVSMSLGAPGFPGQRYSEIFETVARRALRNNTLIIAAAGNESARRFGIKNPVGHPANCPSIMAVAALDSQLQVADFSNESNTNNGGQIDIAGPGVDVYSSWPMPTKYRTISGTSMATPHVSGIAALYAEANPNIDAEGLWSLLIQNAQRLPLPASDIGSGLAQAPLKNS